MGKPWRRAASPRYRGRLCGYEVVCNQRERLTLFLVNDAQLFCPGDTLAFVALCEFKEREALRGNLEKPGTVDRITNKTLMYVTRVDTAIDGAH